MAAATLYSPQYIPTATLGREHARTLHQPYLGQGWTNTPSALNFLYIPSDVIRSVKDSFQAEKLGDGEGFAENFLRILELPFNVASTALNILDWGSIILTEFQLASQAAELNIIPALTKKIPILGIIMSVFESAIEIMGLKGARAMLKTLDMSEIDTLEELKQTPEALQQHFLALLQDSSPIRSVLTEVEFAKFTDTVERCIDPIYPHEPLTSEQTDKLKALREMLLDRLLSNRLLKLHREFCSDAPESARAIDAFVQKHFSAIQRAEKCAYYQDLLQQGQDRHLIRRVYPRSANEMHEKLPKLMQQMVFSHYLGFANPKEQVLDLLKDLQTQSYKKYILNTVGILTAALTIAGCIALLCGCPWAIPFILITIGGVLTYVRYGINISVMTTKGWEIDGWNLVPDCVLKASRRIRSIYRRVIT